MKQHERRFVLQGLAGAAAAATAGGVPGVSAQEGKTLLDGVVACDGAEAAVDLGHTEVRIPTGDRAVAAGARVSVSIASERLRVVDGAGDGDGIERLRATFVERLYLGLTHNDVQRLADGTDLLVRSLASDNEPEPRRGAEVTVGWRRDEAQLHTE